MVERQTSPSGLRAAFSLIELLVVILIFAILVGITVPSLISSQPERNLANAGELFANDISYCVSRASSSGNTIFLGFEYRRDQNQIEGAWEIAGATTSPKAVPDYPTASQPGLEHPANPGVSRTCKAYYIVEERPRWREFDINGLTPQDPGFQPNAVVAAEPYTYLDWLNDYDYWFNSSNQFHPVSNPLGVKFPLEPQYPVDPVETALYSSYFGARDPAMGPSNPSEPTDSYSRQSAPLVLYPMDLSPDRVAESYADRHFDAGGIGDGLYGAIPWADENDQRYKVFCLADREEILAYDVDTSLDANLLRYYERGIDHPRLMDQVVDYVLLKRVELPEHVTFLNPWRNTWVMGWEGSTAADDMVYQDMQFLQYLWGFKPNGEVEICDWTYDPETFPNDSWDGLNHGSVKVRSNYPTARSMWMVLEEAIDFTTTYPDYGTDSYFGYTLPGGQTSVLDNAKANEASAGRMFTIWSVNGKYYVDDYAPNDYTNIISPDDPDLNLNMYYEDTGTAELEFTPLVARERAYSRNFLVP